MDMDKKLINLLTVTKKLDESGEYVLSDKIYNLIKTSQFAAQTPVDYKTVRPSTLSPTLGLFEDLQDTSLGYNLAGGQYGIGSPGKFSGPDSVLVQKTYTPTEYAEKAARDPEGLAKEIVEQGYRTQLQLAKSGASFANIGRLISQWLGPGVPQSQKDSFKNFVLPNTLTSIVSTLLQNTPVTQWSSKMKDLETTATRASPNYSSDISDAIRTSVRKSLNDMKFQNAQNYNALISNPQYRTFARNYNIV